MTRTILQVVDFDSGGTRVRLSDGSFVTLPHGSQVPSIGAEYVGTPLEVADGTFTGRLAGPVNTGPRKIDRLARLIGTASVARAYGDSIADAPLLRAAAQAVAVTPDAALLRMARSRRWRVLDAAAAGAVSKRPVRGA